MTLPEKLPPMRSFTARLSPVLQALRPVASPAAPTRRPRPEPGPANIEIAVRDLTRDELEATRVFAQGQHLARQENWVELGRLVRTFDTQRRRTSGGRSLADLLAAGARADAVEAGRDAVRRGDVRAANDPIEALEEVLRELCEDHGVATVVARAHMDIGQAWLGDSPRDAVPAARKAAFLGHHRAAARIVDRFDPFLLDAPGLAALRCGLLDADSRPSLRMADDYEDLIDLDPQNDGALRQFGRHLLPRWYGSYEALDAEARRTAARTGEVWGAGAYTWIYFDAVALDPMAFRRLDAEFFVEGLHDILDRRDDQHTANVMAAYTGLTLSGMAAPGSARGRIADCFDWILRDHLREIHPLVWAAAPAASHEKPVKGTEDGTRRGRVRALSAIAEHFAADILAGGRVVFSDDGPQVTP